MDRLLDGWMSHRTLAGSVTESIANQSVAGYLFQTFEWIDKNSLADQVKILTKC